jgi:hypothetical protein
VKSIAIDLVSYINLAERKDREEHMEKSLGGCPVPFNRVDAIRLDAPPEAIGIRMKAEHQGSIGVSSIFLSHKKALVEARTRMTNGAFVLLEDDCRFPPSIWHSDLGIARLPQSWEILMIAPGFGRLRRQLDLKNAARSGSGSLLVARVYGSVRSAMPGPCHSDL